MILRDFVKSDYYGLAGAEGWDDNNPPKIGDAMNYFAVFDSSGIEVFLDIEDPLEEVEDEFENWRLDIEITPGFADLIASAMPDYLDDDKLKKLGFKSLGGY